MNRELIEYLDFRRQLEDLGLRKSYDVLAEHLRERTNCELAVLLIWSEYDQKLVTVHESGFVEAPKTGTKFCEDEGLTGKYVFSQDYTVWGKVDLEVNAETAELERRLYRGSEIEKETVSGDVKWAQVERIRKLSKFEICQTFLLTPLVVNDRKRGALQLFNKQTDTNTLDPSGFSQDDISYVESFLSVISDLIESKQKETQTQHILSLHSRLNLQPDNHEKFVNALAEQCCQILDFYSVRFRLLDGDSLNVAGASTKNHSRLASIQEQCDKLAIASIKARQPLSWDDVTKSCPCSITYTDGDETRHVKLSSLDMDPVESPAMGSIIILPILYRDSVVGTIECETSRPRRYLKKDVTNLYEYANLYLNSLLSRTIEHVFRVLNTQSRRTFFAAGQKGDEVKVANQIVQSLHETFNPFITDVHVEIDPDVASQYLLEVQPDRVLPSSNKRDRAANGRPDSVLDKAYTPLRFPIALPRFAHLSANAGHTRRPKEIGYLEATTLKDFPKELKTLLKHAAEYLGTAFYNIYFLRNLDDFDRQVSEIATTAKESLSNLYESIATQAMERFHFDYVVISNIAYEKNHIDPVIFRSNTPLINPEEWVKDVDLASYYDLRTGKDILNYIVDSFVTTRDDAQSLLPSSGSKPEYAIVDPPEDWEVNRGNKSYRLHPILYTEFHHEDLTRLFFPIVIPNSLSNRESYSTVQLGEYVVLGIIEAGFLKKRKRIRTISKQQIELFKLFLKYCAQTLSNVDTLDEKKITVRLLITYFKEVKQDFKHLSTSLLYSLLQECTEAICADNGLLKLLPRDGTTLRFPEKDKALYYDRASKSRPSVENDLQFEDIHFEQENVKGAIENKIYTYTEAKEAAEGSGSEMSVPLRYQDRVIGLMHFRSAKTNCFDIRKANLVQEIADLTVILYEKVRFKEVISNLIKPFDVSTGYSSLLSLLSDFLSTNRIGIWSRKTQEHGQRGLLSVKNDFLDLDFVEQLPEEFALPERLFTKLKRFYSFNELDLDDDLRSQFKISLLVIPIRIGNRPEALILLDTKEQFLTSETAFLDLIVDKAERELQDARILTSFDNIVSVAGNLTAKLHTIAEDAVDLLGADPVVLYRYETEKLELIDSTLIAVGQFLSKKSEGYIRERGKIENDFIHALLHHKKKVISFRTEQEYRRFREKTRANGNIIGTNDFWTREKVKSLVVVKLEYENRVLGLIFFNYRKEIPPFLLARTENLCGEFASRASLVVDKSIAEEEYNDFLERGWKANNEEYHELVRNLIHRFGTHIATLAGALEELEDDIKKLPADERSHFDNSLEALDINVEAVNTTRQQLKYFTSSYIIKNFCIEDVLEEVTARIPRKPKNLSIRKKWASATPTYVRCNDIKMKDVFRNLIHNAIDAMGKRGTLTIETAHDSERENMRIHFIDTGGGIPPEIRPHIFRLGFSRKDPTRKKIYGGSGDGLFFVRLFVNEVGGDVNFRDSHTEDGTIFTITLPIAEGA